LTGAATAKLTSSLFTKRALVCFPWLPNTGASARLPRGFSWQFFRRILATGPRGCGGHLDCSVK
jgi:hypothetical protein